VWQAWFYKWRHGDVWLRRARRKAVDAAVAYEFTRRQGEVGAAPRAVELGRRAIELVNAEDPHRAALLHVRLGEYLNATGGDNALLAAFERAVELVPAQQPSPERAYSLGSLAGALMVARRYAESLPISEQALALAWSVGAREAEVRALTVLGGDLAYLGRGEEGLTHLRQALELAEEIGDRIGLERAYVNITDALTMLGRPRESARLGQSGLEVIRRYGIESTLLVSNQVEALLALGDWDEAQRLSAAALRGITASFPSDLLIIRADVEIGRGDFDAARAHLEAASASPRADHALGLYDAHFADLALWERRWTPTRPSTQVWLGHARAGLRGSGSRCAPKGCAHMRNWQLSHAPAGMPTPYTPGSSGQGNSSPSLGTRRSTPQRSHRTSPAGSLWPRPNTSAPTASPSPGRGRRPPPPGSGSSALRSRPTAAGVRPRHSSLPPAPRRGAGAGGWPSAYRWPIGWCG
jgi:tetratricopeptide (TPR) repeat protein